MTTEIIASKKPVLAKFGEMFLVTTKSGAVIWVMRSQLPDNAENITYEQHAVGSTYTNNKTGESGVRKVASNEFIGFGKASKFDVLDYLKAQGVTPTFSLS